jgi:ketosteroid isomerase-like protein
MPTPTAVAQRLYDAMAHADGIALFGLLTEDFVGTVSTGMPHGVGGEHHGAADMITEVWARIASVYEMHVEPHDYLHVDDERVVVLAGSGTRPATAVRPWTPSSPTSSPRAVARSQRCNRSPTPPGRA